MEGSAAQQFEGNDSIPTAGQQNNLKEAQMIENLLLQQQMQSEEKLMNLIIIDLNNKEIHLKMVQYELVLELREFLNEHALTCFFTHYYFEHSGKKLNDYTELRELNLLEDNKIYMRPEKYDEKSARSHIRKLKEILSIPPVLTSQTDQGIFFQQQYSEKNFANQKNEEKQSQVKENKESAEVLEKLGDDQQKIENKESEGAVKENEQVHADNGEEEKVGDNQQEAFSEQEEKMKKNYEDFLKIIEKESKKDIVIPNKLQGNVLNELFRNSIDQEMNKIKHLKCIEALQFSSFNPVPPYRRLVGDLFYLYVKTLEGVEFGITSCANGFYRNNNIEQSVFNPTPYNKGNPAYSYTLVGCIYQVSQQFGKNLETYINSILTTEPYFLTQPPLPINSWILSEEELIKKNQFSQRGVSSTLGGSSENDSSSQTLIPLYGLDPKGIRDWNEEFQVVKGFPKETIMQRTQRDRAIIKVYNDFLEAATKGAIAIVNGNLMPLNPNEPEKQQVFVYNYIFFSFAVDLIDSFKDLTSSDNNPSFTQANHDIMGLRTLQILDIDGLHILATCLVQYKGQRVIAQSIIPGILNNNDLTSLAEYGSVDEQKTIYASEHFHNLMKQVCANLNIKVNKVIDGQGKEVEIAGSVEVKGIKGTDKRNYLVDLQGLTPRDANYLGEEYHTCLLRPELLIMYQRTKNIEYASQKIQAVVKEWEEQAKVTEDELKDLNEQQRIELEERKKAELNFKKLREFDRLIKEAPKYQFNTNVLKNVKLAMTEEEKEKEEEQVKDLAKFLKEKAIEKLIQDLQNVEGVPTDSESLETAFHQHGVNMRYLGDIGEQLKSKDLYHIQLLIEKEVIFRAFKHILNEQMRLSNDTYLSSVISHLLNILLAPFPFIQLMDEDKLQFSDETIQNKIQSVQNEVKVNNGGKQDEQQEEQEQEKEGQSEAKGEGSSQLSKKEKKKLKKKQKKEENKDQNVPAGVVSTSQNAQEQNQQQKASVDYNDFLFRPQQESQSFNINELFLNAAVSKNLLKLDPPEILSLKPSQLYERIRQIAVTRYQYKLLPEKMTELRVLQYANNKYSLLRDICIKLGIKIVSRKDKEFILDNDVKILQSKLLEQVNKQNQNQSKQNSKKKQQSQQQQQYLQQQAAVKIEELMTYQNLPFQINDIVEVYPVLKHLDIQNSDVRALLQTAKQAYKDGFYEKAFELYSQSINTMLSISGPMNKDVAACISKLASIQFKFGDFLQAIELQTKSIILSERILGPDHPQTAYGYSNLALYYHTCGYFSKGFEYMYRSLNVLKISCGENHPDISSIYLNLGLMYQDYENFQAAKETNLSAKMPSPYHSAIDCFTESLYRNIQLFGEKHLQVASCYQALAHAYFQIGDYRRALDQQEKAHKILEAILPPDDQYIKSSQAQMNQFMQLSVLVEKAKNADKQARPIGSNKPSNQIKGGIGTGKGQTQGGGESKGNQPQKLNQLFQRMANPKNRNPLDQLEYNYIREQYLERILKAQLDEAKAKQSEENQNNQQ